MFRINNRVIGRDMKTVKIALCLSVLFGLPAYAVTKCIALNPNTTCTEIKPETYHTDWGSDCSGIAIRGVSVCGHVDGGKADNRAVQSVWVSSDPNQNRACFCKIVQPVVSRWTYAETQEYAGNCAQWCPLACAGKLGDATNNRDFRNVILGEFYE